MRFLLLLPLLVFAPVSSAQRSAADSALVDRLIVALQFDLAESAMDSARAASEARMPENQRDASAPMLDAMTDLSGVADSTRARFLAHFRPDLIRTALPVLTGPAMQEVQAAMQSQEISARELASLVLDTGDRPLADSALIVDYARAMQGANALDPDRLRALGRQFYRAIDEAMPDSIAAGADLLGGEDVFVEQMVAQQTDAALSLAQIQTLRALLYGVEASIVRDLTAYYDSEAGVYVSQTVALASQQAMMPRMIASTKDMIARYLSATSTDEPLSETLFPPPAEIYEVVETPPELIGGLDGLMARVVYPESARLEGVEGRVFVTFVVEPDGSVSDAVCARGRDVRLCGAAVAAVSGSTFTPGLNRGVPVRARSSVPVNFALQASQPAVADQDPVLIGGEEALHRRARVPESARRRGIEGEVYVRFTVDVEGLASDASCAGTPDASLCEAAIAAILESRFEPALRDGAPVEVQHVQVVRFLLR